MTRPKNSFIFTAVLLVAGAAIANEASGGHAEHSVGLSDEILKTVIYQAINVGAIILGLIYFLKSTVKKFFAEKKATYVAAAEKSLSARKVAEEQHLQIKIQLNKLESTADESVSRAKAEAAEMKSQMLAEAQAISKRIRDEAALTAKLEIEKAKVRLREDLMKEAFLIAETQMNSKVSKDDHARLQGEFINNIQAVHR